MSLVHRIDRRVFKIRLCGNAICRWIISGRGPGNPTRNESQELFQPNDSRYGRNHYFEPVRQRENFSHIKPVTPIPLSPCNILYLVKNCVGGSVKATSLYIIVLVVLEKLELIQYFNIFNGISTIV